MLPSGQRPDPDALLRRVTAEASRADRAKLKIFLGYAPGVGKTFKMLQLAADLVLQKVDLAVGYLDTHGRFDTGALLLGLELLPRRHVPYRDKVLDEFDLDAALARKPKVILVDELAHTNVPGVRHAKRWQDVLDLLDAGIDVHTTLNIQHVESLNDVVAQITGVQVRETVPDSILERADSIELVDVPPDELIARLAAGKIYLPDVARRAADHFFQRGNLLALRELALRLATEHVDDDVRQYREDHQVEATWAAAERILVCVGPSPAAARLIRAGTRMAAGLRAPWTVVYVDPIGSALGEEDRRTLDANLHLAESLGAEVIRLAATRASTTVLAYARRNGVTRLIAGKPTHSRLRDLLRGSFLDEVIRGSGDIDVHVITGASGPPLLRKGATETEGSSPAKYAWAGVIVGVTTALAVALRGLIAVPDPEMIYLLAIMVSAIWLGRGPALLAAAASVAAYDFVFVPPVYTFTVSDSRYLLTFGMMFGVGVVMSTLATRLRQQEREATIRAERTAALYALSADLGAALDVAQIGAVCVRHAVGTLGGGAVVLLADDAGIPVPSASLPSAARLDPADEGVARWVLEHGREAGAGTDTLPGARGLCLPLRAGQATLGVLAVLTGEGRALASEQHSFAEALARQVAFALERVRLVEEAKAIALRARAEETRSALLSAVSHDLRTPLATITGAGTTLRDELALPEQTKRELAGSICEQADRLERLVSNLLEMTRLQAGQVTVKRDWVPLEELVGSSLNRLDAKLQGREIQTDLSRELPLVAVDPLLIEQVLVNLIDNATKYTPTGSPIAIGAQLRSGAIEITVADRGPGFQDGEEDRVFEKFWRGAHAGVGGVGLGLAICRGIVEAHGGTIRAERRVGGGALFRIVLPLVGTPPAPPPVEVEAADG